MLNKLKLVNFKNHTNSLFDFSYHNLIVGPNGSGKTNILEAIYLIINTHSYGNSKLENLLNNQEKSFLIASNIIKNSLDFELKNTFDKNINKSGLIINNSKITRSKFLEDLNLVAIFFAPQEINIIYLGPSLRRDFLDEVAFLTSPTFLKIKKDYQKILKNRNKLLKNIKEGKAQISDLKFWDLQFISIASSYYKERKKFLDYVQNNLYKIENLLENKYSLIFEYITKVDWNNLETSISNYLNKNIERDIILGYTYIGPHLDDFNFSLNIFDKKVNTSEYLSRGENKSILIGLKILEIEYFKNIQKKDVIILLDDIFSELDDEHINLMLNYTKNSQTFITAQNIPNFLLENSEIKIINLY